MIYHVPSWVGFMLWALHCGAQTAPMAFRALGDLSPPGKPGNQGVQQT